MPLYTIKTTRFGAVLLTAKDIKEARKKANEMFPKMNRTVSRAPREYKRCEVCDSKPCCC